MSPFLLNFLIGAQHTLLWVMGFFILFGVLSRIMPCNREQPVFQKSIFTDIAYCLIIPVFTRFVSTLYAAVGVTLIFRGMSEDHINDNIMHGFGPIGTLPLWAQGAIAFILSDIILYWTHRMFHGRKLWRFHSIHHSSTQVDWHSTYRFHPINIWLSFTLVDSVMIFIGCSVESIAMMGAFNMLYSAMVHANLNWTFGPFKYLFASPVFHRWHHTYKAEGMNKNFAPTFPLLDIMFGTFYMPEGRLPEHYGVPGANIPESFLGQLAYPFRRAE